jgi:hypothetical protein
VQFIYRERITGDGKRYPGRVCRSADDPNSCYYLTTDAANPVWSTDAALRPNPYQELTRNYRSDCYSRTYFDQPSFSSAVYEPGETSRATVKAFAICGGKVVREITWTLERRDGVKDRYIVETPKVPDEAQIKKFQAISLAQGYYAWP